MFIRIEASKNHTVKSYTDLGWTSGVQPIKLSTPTSATSRPSGNFTLSWSHDSEPIFPENAQYTVLG